MTGNTFLFDMRPRNFDVSPTATRIDTLVAGSSYQAHTIIRK